MTRSTLNSPFNRIAGQCLKSVWYRFTPPAVGATLNVDISGTDYYNALSAWTDSPGNFTHLSCAETRIGLGGVVQVPRLRLIADSTSPIYFMVTTISDLGVAGTLVFNLTVVDAPAATLSASSLTFAPQMVNTTSAAQSVTLTNSGTVPLTLSSMTLGGPSAGPFTKSDNCGTSLSAGTSCTINVTTRPTEAGPCAASIAIADNAPGSPHMITLSGMATDFSVSPASGSTTSATVNAGQTATYALSLAGTSGFSDSASLACSGAPNAASCTVVPSTVNLSGTTPVSATVSVTTTARAMLPPVYGPWSGPPLHFVPLPLWALLLLAALLWVARLRAQRFAVQRARFRGNHGAYLAASGRLWWWWQQWSSASACGHASGHLHPHRDRHFRRRDTQHPTHADGSLNGPLVRGS